MRRAVQLGLYIGMMSLCVAAAPYQKLRPQTQPQTKYIIFEVSEFFIDVLGDVPLQDGIDVDYDSLLIFDKADGRYIEIMAYPREGLGKDTVSQFYGQSLPMLGWHTLGHNQYKREKEVLKISFPDNENGWAIRFEVSPEKK